MCDKSKSKLNAPTFEKSEMISAVDLSSYPEILEANPIFRDADSNQIDLLKTLKAKGVNTIRLRLWVNPKNQHSGLDEVKHFAEVLKAQEFKIWITLHYSDTWADPAHQVIPQAWQGLSFNSLKDSVYSYTKKIVATIHPDYIQIGNEINPGLLIPQGQISNNLDQFLALIDTATKAVRLASNSTRIMLHFAGIKGSDWFFNNLKTIDYDIIGLSYYPIWHGKSLDSMEQCIKQLSINFQKKVIIAETAYPFTLKWNDWTNNILGTEDQLILPDFPATPIGQHAFISSIKHITMNVKSCIGFCYWGGELVAWKGNQAQDGSPWENQALFDFNNKALPVLDEFKIE